MISFKTAIIIIIIIGILIGIYVLTKPNFQVTPEMIQQDLKNVGSDIDKTLKSDEFKQGVKKLGDDVGKVAGAVKDGVVKFATDENTKSTLVSIKDGVVDGVKGFLSGTADIVCSAGPTQKCGGCSQDVCQQCGKHVVYMQPDDASDSSSDDGLDNDRFLCDFV